MHIAGDWLPASGGCTQCRSRRPCALESACAQDRRTSALRKRLTNPKPCKLARFVGVRGPGDPGGFGCSGHVAEIATRPQVVEANPQSRNKQKDLLLPKLTVCFLLGSERVSSIVWGLPRTRESCWSKTLDLPQISNPKSAGSPCLATPRCLG